jgi:hypothetical protein
MSSVDVSAYSGIFFREKVASCKTGPVLFSLKAFSKTEKSGVTPAVQKCGPAIELRRELR